MSNCYPIGKIFFNSILLKVKIIESLHNEGIVHLDLKLENILIRNNDFTTSESSEIALIDFNTSQKFSKSEEAKTKYFKGNLAYSSIE